MNINEIANFANNKKKLNKMDMWNEYKKLVGYLDVVCTDKTTQKILVNMYNYFQPPAPAKPKTAEQWIAKAMASTGDVRHYLKFIYSDGTNLVATNGHRLHMQQNTTYSEGFYNKNMEKIDEEGGYPDYKRVLHNNRKGNQSVTVAKIDILNREVKVENGREVINPIADVWVDKGYLLGALSFLDATEQVKVTYATKNDGVGLDFADCQAMVMPVRI